MRTLSLQWLATLVQLLFALAALAVARRAVSAEILHRAAWRLTGVAFGVGGALMLVQDVAGTWAFVAGPESGAWATYLRWAPAANQSRTGLEIGLGGAFVVLLRRRAADRRFWGLAAGLLLLGVLAGALVGELERGWSSQVHYPAVALFDMLEMMVLLGMLFLALLTRGMDWMLWVILLFHALTLAFNAIWFTALAWLGIPGMWAPRPWQVQAYMVLFLCLKLGMSLWRLVRARHGVPVPALLDLIEPTKSRTPA
jgi:hypothetical protein